MDFEEPETGLDFSPLDPDMRAVAMVGAFLQEFARMEDTVEEALAMLAGVRPEHMFLFEHIAASRKIDALKKLVQTAAMHPDVFASAVSSLKRMHEISQSVRNRLAHDTFRAVDGGLATTEPGLKGAVIKMWTWDAFEKQINDCRAAKRPLVDLMFAQQWKDFAAKFSRLVANDARRRSGLAAMFEPTATAVDEDDLVDAIFRES